MSKSNTIQIDLDKWMTQQQKANERKCSVQYINKLIRQGKLNSLRLDAINIVLVER